jgi:predicted transposase YbfD/YdcC
MTTNFLDHIKEIEDHRIVGMTTYPLDEVLLTALVGLLCRVEDFDEIEMLCADQLEWLRQFLPFNAGIAPAQTLRRVLSALCPRTLEDAFAAWVGSLQKAIHGVVAIDGKTLRGSKLDANGDGALHVVSAYAHQAGLVLAQRAVEGKSNEITAIPDVLDMLEINGAIITIDAIGTQKSIAAKIIAKKADYLLALKANQKALHDDVVEFFSDPELTVACPQFDDTSFGHGRIEHRTCRVATTKDWLVERHPQWQNLHSIAEVTVQRTNNKKGNLLPNTVLHIFSRARSGDYSGGEPISLECRKQCPLAA